LASGKPANQSRIGVKQRYRSPVRARRAADRRLVDIDDLVEVLDPVEPFERGRRLARIVEPLGQCLIEGLDDQGRFAAARHAGDAAERAKRISAVTSFRLLPRAPTNRRIWPRMAATAVAGTGIWRIPVKYWPVMLSAIA